VSVKVNLGKKDPSYPTFDQMLYLAPMLREENGKRNCKNCWVQFNFTQHMTNPSKTKNNKMKKIMIKYNGFDLCPYSYTGTIKVQMCEERIDQTWAFFSV